MKMQKSDIVVKKKNKNNYVKDQKYRKIRDHCHYTGEYRAAVYSIFNLKHSISKKIHIALDNGSNGSNGSINY